MALGWSGSNGGIGDNIKKLSKKELGDLIKMEDRYDGDRNFGE